MKRLIDGNALASLFRTRRALDGNPTAQDAFETAMWDAAQAEEITLNDLRDEVYQDALEHGLWEDGFDADKTIRQCAERVMDETIELLEEEKRVRSYVSIRSDKKAKEAFERFTEELADVIIMSLSVAGKLGIDIDAAVKRKMEINKHRPWKHEGEKHEG